VKAKTFKQALAPLLLIVFNFMFNIFSRSILSPLLLDVEAEFAISHTRASQLFLFVSLGHALMMLLSGFVSSRIGHRRTIVFSSLVIAVGLVFVAASFELYLLQVSLLFLGLGAGLYPPSGISVITSMVERSDWQKALSIHELGPHFGMALVPLFAVFMSIWLPWRLVVLAAAVCVVLAVTMFHLFIRVDNEKGEVPVFSNLLPLLKIPSFWILMVFMGFFLGSIQGIYLIIPTFLVAEAGFDAVYANTIFGISRFVPIAALLSSVFVLDRIGLKRTIFITMLSSGIAIILLGLLSGNYLVAAIFLQPAVGAVTGPSIIAAISSIAPKRSRNVAFSIALPAASVLGNGVIPSFVGYTGDAASFSAGFIIIGVIMALLAFLTFSLDLRAHHTVA
jgi:NNP family nitrate/nitrite transporter-like MFS transporter